MAIKPKKPAQNGDVTIDRVAAAAGVSRATVSRVMNGSAKVSPEREKAVKKAIAAYNFTPNATARRLAGGRSGLVALLMEESSEEFFLNSIVSLFGTSWLHSQPCHRVSPRAFIS